MARQNLALLHARLMSVSFEPPWQVSVLKTEDGQAYPAEPRCIMQIPFCPMNTNAMNPVALPSGDSLPTPLRRKPK